MGKRRIPWTELERARGDYIEPKYLPKQVALKQYYHLRQKDVSDILEHWTRRQAAGKVPLCFMKVVRASEDSGTGTDMEPVEGEENLQDDKGSQTQEDGPTQGDSSTNCSAKQIHSGESPADAAEDPNRVSLILKHDK